MIKITNGKKNIWVTFVVECEEDVIIKGSWDNWQEHQMKQRKDGKYSFKRVFKLGEYEFGYLANNQWFIEDGLQTVPNPYSGNNSLLIIK